MSKLLISFAIGAVALLVSCEPLPPNPPPGYRPLLPDTNGRQDDFRRSRDPYFGRPDRDDRFGSRDRGPGIVESEGARDNQFETTRPPSREEYPTAERTANPNQVLSPYAPYNVIDVEGFRSGQLAKDPSNGKIFRVP